MKPAALGLRVHSGWAALVAVAGPLDAPAVLDRRRLELAAILASHALIHTADGELYRDALADAAGHCGLGLLRVKERELLARGARVLKVREETLLPRLGQMGRALGPPWRQDEKLAALAAWLALAERPREGVDD